MKSKKFFVGGGIIILLVIVTAFTFFILPNKSLFQKKVVYTSTTPRDVDWEKSLPAIFQAFRTQFLGSRAGENSPVRIYKTGDITGDGISEAIVDIGLQGGYSNSSYMKLMMVENDVPITPGFKIWNGNYSSDHPFQIGTGGNGIFDIILLPTKNVLYESIRTTDPDGFCGITAYQWNPETKTFDFNKKISEEIKIDVCK